MSVRSRRMAGPIGIGAVQTTIFTCPAGRTAVIRACYLSNVGPFSAFPTAQINGTRFWRSGISPESTAAFGNVILNPGDVLSVAVPGGQPMEATVFGSLLLGAPA